MDTYELAKIVGGRHAGRSTPFRGFSTDSRSVSPGQVFVALRGKVHDGHHFVLEALQRGAVGLLVERPLSLPYEVPCVLVQDSLEALRSFARWRRKNFTGKVIAVAGSAGKTTTKELLAYLLSKVGKVCKTPKNYNSQVGVPLSVANFEEDCQFWVVEVGASQRGEVKRLVELVEPHIRVITAIGEEHLQTFGSLEDVLAGNGEVFYYMRDSDWGVCPQEVAYHYRLPKVLTFGGEDFCPEQVELSLSGVSFKLNGVDLYLPVPSLAIVKNALCALRVLEALGIDWEGLSQHLKHFQPVEGRFRVLHRGELVLIDDTYNACLLYTS
ncbi:MAG: UDP-N-acetylmuramoyl-tripeptide--D-alanyl-D-alanine ligase, partial [Aquificaceae bacterium]|nr:UDP-N-acetylmuramoyl-tripeptide--D-alanyl-D-alanine ligase [Aquificaceae bacterium]